MKHSKLFQVEVDQWQPLWKHRVHKWTRLGRAWALSMMPCTKAVILSQAGPRFNKTSISAWIKQRQRWEPSQSKWALNLRRLQRNSLAGSLIRLCLLLIDSVIGFPLQDYPRYNNSGDLYKQRVSGCPTSRDTGRALSLF